MDRIRNSKKFVAGSGSGINHSGYTALVVGLSKIKFKLYFVIQEDGSALVISFLHLLGTYIGGGNVSAGYFKMEEKTQEEFYTDHQDTRWFRQLLTC